MKNVLCMFTLFSVIFSFSLSYLARFFVFTLHTRNHHALDILTAAPWRIGTNSAYRSYIVFGKYHNAAFISNVYPPNQLYFYKFQNATHGYISSGTTSEEDGVHLFDFALSLTTGRLVLYKNDHTPIVCTPEKTLNTHWELCDNEEFVAVTLGERRIIFDLKNRFGFFGVTEEKDAKYNCTFEPI